jgi:hypothetical protein
VGEDVDEVIRVRCLPEGYLQRALLFGFRNGRLSYALIHRTLVGVVNRREI